MHFSASLQTARGEVALPVLKLGFRSSLNFMSRARSWPLCDPRALGVQLLGRGGHLSALPRASPPVSLGA